MDPDVTKIAQIVTVFVVAISVLSIVTHYVKARYLKEKRKSELPASSMSVDDSRFERLERAVDAIALEVERMTEAQRFTAKLMTERAPERIASAVDASTESNS
jgi:hypothetical protein